VGWGGVGNVDNPSPPHNSIIVFYLLQGSYGIVKLAYNEEDDTHYVSISTTETKFTYLESDFMKFCIYLFILFITENSCGVLIGVPAGKILQ
jgi:hypothetical protein